MVSGQIPKYALDCPQHVGQSKAKIFDQIVQISVRVTETYKFGRSEPQIYEKKHKNGITFVKKIYRR